MHLRTPEPADRPELLSLAIRTGLFAPDEAESLLGGVLDASERGELGPGHVILRLGAEADGSALGWTYFAPDAFADGVWNLWWIGVEPSAHGTGAGTRLLREVEAAVTESGARVLVVETSDRAPLGRARAFYRREGYRECGRVPDFYGPADAKVIFAKTFSSP